MPVDLRGSRFFAGLKQSAEAVSAGLAKKAYIAEDADDKVTLPFKRLCEENNVEIIFVENKKQLGKACGINVAAACAVLLK